MLAAGLVAYIWDSQRLQEYGRVVAALIRRRMLRHRSTLQDAEIGYDRASTRTIGNSNNFQSAKSFSNPSNRTSEKSFTNPSKRASEKSFSDPNFLVPEKCPTYPSNLNKELPRLPTAYDGIPREKATHTARPPIAPTKAIILPQSKQEKLETPEIPSISWQFGTALLVLFGLTFVLFITLRIVLAGIERAFSLFASLYLAGTIIFGGRSLSPLLFCFSYCVFANPTIHVAQAAQ